MLSVTNENSHALVVDSFSKLSEVSMFWLFSVILINFVIIIIIPHVFMFLTTLIINDNIILNTLSHIRFLSNQYQ